MLITVLTLLLQKSIKINSRIKELDERTEQQWEHTKEVSDSGEHHTIHWLLMSYTQSNSLILISRNLRLLLCHTFQ